MAPPVENPNPTPSEPPVVRISNREEDSMNNEPSQSGKQIIGIIYPPPDIRNIVDKTAGFVARNGAEFENRIRISEAKNPKFNFLNPADPYHSYYQHKIKEFREGTLVESSIAKPQITVPRIQEAVKQAEVVPSEPPPEFEFTAEASTLNATDLDVIKLTALFCARNGRQFLTQLMNREARNPQFDFLKPAHSNFSYFTRLVEQYTKILLPPKDLVPRMKAEIANPKLVLETVQYRVDWERHQRRIKEKEAAELERERVAYAQIDWHDFVVVQTVDFQPNESTNLPPPCTPKDVGARVLAQARAEAAKAAVIQDVEMEVESSDDEEDDKPPEPPTDEGDNEMEVETGDSEQQPAPPDAAPPKADTVTIRPYNPKSKIVEKIKQAEKWVISPLTGEKIPADKLHEHMRYNTVDQQYFAQKEKEQQDKNDEPVFASGIDVSSNIRAFAERRSDIFGVGSDQTVIGEKLGEEEDRPNPNTRAIWDGHSNTINQITKQAQNKITIEQQMAEIRKVQQAANEAAEKISAHPGQGPSGSTANMSAGGRPHPAATGANNTPLPPRQPLRPPPPPQQAPPVPQMPPQPPPQMQMPPIRPPVRMMVPPQPVLYTPVVVPMPAMPPQMPQQHMPPRMPPHMPPMGMGQPQPGTVSWHEPPAAKRQRTEADLIPEDVFLQKHSGQVSVRIDVPNAPDKSEWKLNGQVITMQFAYTDNFGQLKEKLQDALGMPPGKQKLVFDNMFPKDNQTFAFYNIENGGLVQLQVKERGGRKK